MVLTLSYDSFNSGVDKYVTLDDGSQVWICDYHSPISSDQPENPEKTPILCKIECSSPTIKIGSRLKTFKGIITDPDGNTLDLDGVFSIDSNFSDKILLNTSVSNQAKIKIQDDYSELSGTSFNLSFTVGSATATLLIQIEE